MNLRSTVAGAAGSTHRNRCGGVRVRAEREREVRPVRSPGAGTSGTLVCRG
jgi:hypothetical protein